MKRKEERREQRERERKRKEKKERKKGRKEERKRKGNDSAKMLECGRDWMAFELMSLFFIC